MARPTRTRRSTGDRTAESPGTDLAGPTCGCTAAPDPSPGPGSGSTEASAGTGTHPDAEAPGTSLWRPTAHFSPEQNWMNDPNGLVFDEGTYHLFYQYNPHGNVWGNMSWGHATSTDLVHWTELPVAMEASPDAQFFSGSIVIDHDNSSGLGSPEAPAWVALYTRVYGEGSGHPVGTQAQALAYSLDKGATWAHYREGEPVLGLTPESRSFRDPKVVRHEAGACWVMATVVADDRVVKLYRSDDLLEWEWLSDVRGVGAGAQDPAVLWEMPDLFPLPVKGGGEKWVLLLSINPGSVAGGSGMQYFVGDFDGTTFTPQDVAAAGSDPTAFNWVDRGADFYAATTVTGAPDSQKVMIGWMDNWDYAADVPTAPWRGSLAIPRDLALEGEEGSLELVSTISPEAQAVLGSGTRTELGDTEVVDARIPLPPDLCAPRQLISVTLAPGDAASAGLVVRTDPRGSRGTLISYDTRTQSLILDRSASGVTDFSPAFSHRHVVPLPLEGRSLDLTVLVDRSSVEVFADGGRRVVTDIVLPPTDATCLALFAQGGRATFRRMTVTTP